MSIEHVVLSAQLPINENSVTLSQMKSAKMGEKRGDDGQMEKSMRIQTRT